MFYNEEQAMNSCLVEPNLVFKLIKEGHVEIVDKLLSKKKIDINTKDNNGDDILTKLLKYGYYDIVIKYVLSHSWNPNNQNNEGDTFLHILSRINYTNVIDIIKKIKKNKNLDLNILNSRGETILDSSNKSGNIYMSIFLIKDNRFNNISLFSFVNTYNMYIKNSEYGKYSKITNMEIILDGLEDKKLDDSVNKVVDFLVSNFDKFKDSIFNNKTTFLDNALIDMMENS